MPIHDIEIHEPHDYYYNATFYAAVTTTTAAWQRVDFIDHLGDEFSSCHIRLRVMDHDMDFSFDGRSVDDAHRVIQGALDSSDDIVELKDKHATGIWIKRHAADNATIRIYAWRS